MTTGKRLHLHEKIRDEMERRFADLSYFSPVPGERELCRSFGVSRPTVRKALDLLEEENKIVRMQGRGSFYTGEKIPVDYSETQTRGFGLAQMFSAEGRVTRSTVLQQVVEAARGNLAAMLSLPEETLVFHLKRLRYVDEHIYAVTDDYIPLALCPALVRIDFTTHGLLRTLEEYDVRPYAEDKTIEVVRATPEIALYLEVAEEAPIFVTRILTTDAAGRVIQYATSKADAFRSRFRVRSTAEK
nr:GntR family transcriptional regulator [Selenomonas artemidis]